MKEVITMSEVTAEQVINSDASKYNASEWKKTVLRYKEGTFFKDEEEKDLFYVVYKIEEGLIFFSELSYHSCIHNGGFTRMLIVHGKYMGPEVINDLKKDERFKSLTATNSVAYKMGFGSDRTQRVTNSRQGRKWLVENICKHGLAVTNN